MKTQEEYAREIDEIVLRDVESCQSDWFKIDKEIFMLPENKNIRRNTARRLGKMCLMWGANASSVWGR